MIINNPNFWGDNPQIADLIINQKENISEKDVRFLEVLSSSAAESEYTQLVALIKKFDKGQLLSKDKIALFELIQSVLLDNTTIEQRQSLDKLLVPSGNLETEEKTFRFDAFLSFAEEDKTIATTIYQRLKARGCRIWFSGQELQIGNSIIGIINWAILRSRFALILFSPHTIQKKKHFPMLELEAFVNQSLYGKLEELLILYHQMTHQEVVNQFPLLADSFALSTDLTPSHLIDELVAKFKASPAL